MPVSQPKIAKAPKAPKAPKPADVPAADAVDVPAAVPTTVPAGVKTARPKSTFMLHDPVTMAGKGKFVAPGYREAALKAASRGNTKILLRKCGTSEIREFEGSIVMLDDPKPVVRGTQSVMYSKKSHVKFIGKHAFDGDVDADVDA